MKNTMKNPILFSRLTLAALAAASLAACGAGMEIPYSIATSPTVWITYPTECATENEELSDGGLGPSQCAADGVICLTGGTNTIPVYFAVFNQPPGSVVRIRLDRHLGDSPARTILTNTSPVFMPVDASVAEGGHLIDAEIVNADGSALSAAQTKNLSHKFQAYFITSPRTPAVSGTALESELFCAEVGPCADDDQCDKDQVCMTRHRGSDCSTFIANGRTCPLGICEAACTANADCEAVHAGEVCDVVTGRCVNCTASSQCEGDTICQLNHDPEEGELPAGLCEPRCTADNADEVCYFEGETCNVATGVCEHGE
jgi:hypothetical protein